MQASSAAVEQQGLEKGLKEIVLVLQEPSVTEEQNSPHGKSVTANLQITISHSKSF